MAVRGKAFDRSPPSKILRLPREGGKRVFISRHRGEKLTTPFPLGLVHPPHLALEPFLSPFLDEFPGRDRIYRPFLFPSYFRGNTGESVSGRNADHVSFD